MSIKAMNWAWGVDLPNSGKLVLLCLADHADNDGVCWPGHAAVSEKTGISARHVSRIVNVLAVKGILRINERKSDVGRQMANAYCLNLNCEDWLASHVWPIDMVSIGSDQKPLDKTSTSRTPMLSIGTTRVFEPPVEPSTRARASKIRFEGNRFVGIPDELRKKWAEVFQTLNIDAEIAAAELWWLSNEGKHRRDIGKFLTNWLKRAVSGTKSYPAPPQLGATDHRCTHVDSDGYHCEHFGTMSADDGKTWRCRDHPYPLPP